MAVAVIFPGQGTQGAGMGVPWESHPAWSVVERAEAALGEPLAPLLRAESADELARTRESQLSVLLTSLVIWEAARDRLTGAAAPAAFAGHSLGQITALIASGALPFDDGIRLAARRAEATQAAADRHPGRMAAMIGADEAQVADACAAAPDECWLANDNAPGQIVIAGTPSGVERATKAAADLGIRRVLPLKVGGAFHTPLMEEAATALAPVLEGITFSAPAAPIVSNTDARPYGGADGWAERLGRHLISPVRWRGCMTTLVDELGVTTLIEVGYGSMLAGLAKRGAPGATVIGVATPGDIAPLSEVRP
ncbi:MAG TPA: ACP S-malonyltransferase [Acidimicrobiia bacterium]|nr:ACP S-malonyltransferase [Acidimicrobiia bacterium]